MPQGGTRTPKALRAPVASDDVTVQGDFLELIALAASDKNVSSQDLVQLLRRSGSVVDAEVEEEEDSAEEKEDDEEARDRGSETSQSIAQLTFDELDDRFLSCGGASGTYPFSLESEVLQLGDNLDSPYLFMLLLTRFGIGAGPKNIPGEQLFEDLSRHAAERYFGGHSLGATAIHFGFPRRILPKGFASALDEVCRRVGSAEMASNTSAPKRKSQKDGKLDIVAWRDFPDRRVGKLIGFGQCAAGVKAWRDKTRELVVDEFFKKWLRTLPAVNPVRLFFVPWRLQSADHRDICVEGGITFDRCRVAYFCDDVGDELAARCGTWVRHVARKQRLRNAT